jgi:hypothetical protein
MDSSDGGADTGSLFDQLDAAIEIVAAEKDVIEQNGHVLVVFVSIARGPRNRGSCERAAS